MKNRKGSYMTTITTTRLNCLFRCKHDDGSYASGEDSFFDAYDEIRNSIDSLSSDNSLVAHQELELRSLEYELWLREPMSVQDRRTRFLRGMGFDEFVASSVGCSTYAEAEDSAVVSQEEQLDLERIIQDSGAVLNSLTSPDSGQSDESFCYIRDLDNGRKFIVHELGKDGLPSLFKEVGSDKLITLQDFEILIGLAQSVQKLLRREVSPFGEKITCTRDTKNNKYLNWWKSLAKRKLCVGASKYDVSMKKTALIRTTRTKVYQCRKSCTEFTALYMNQEIQSHKGMVRTMKFCPSGRYLASGGEDCIVRIWQIIQVDSSCRYNTSERSSRFSCQVKGINLVPRKGSNFAPVFIPKNIFKIKETPLQELQGHTSDILDLSWSQSNYLLTSSKDKTVRMWKVGYTECLKVFQHNDYVTCIQFNPIEDRYFISGSIDGKVRVWEIPENRVIDWVDVRDMVTAISYQPDGKGFVVGSIKGNCHFYDCSARTSQLTSKLSLFGQKKSSRKPVTGLQFCPGDSKRLMIISADSKIRISDGVNVILKFKGGEQFGPRKNKCQLSASFTSDGRHIISMGEDSNVHIWNFDKSGELQRRGVKSVRSSEFFFSKGALIAVPWPGMMGRETAMSNSIHNSSQPNREPVTWLMNPDCFSLGKQLFSDCSSRLSATWPEEKLSLPSMKQLHPEDCWSFVPAAGMWSSVIVTAGNDGTIRCFHNYGFPIRL
ncbi:2-deoxy-glucose resistant protein 2-like [Canna indica]|uniref:2-deoxy-glucose resistant protein 2-like n=1 Tax=Canna indica TaxID=4628 RepID=A0AAQ3Q3P8_9LILI|nr:2-deoxy-glucose resistant protein 2-like [Canna indica]